MYTNSQFKRNKLGKFRTHVKGNLTLAVPLKNDMDIENYVHQLVHTIQQAAWNSTPNPKKPTNMAACIPMIKQKILDKRSYENSGKTPDHRKLRQNSTWQ